MNIWTVQFYVSRCGREHAYEFCMHKQSTGRAAAPNNQPLVWHYSSLACFTASAIGGRRAENPQLAGITSAGGAGPHGVLPKQHNQQGWHCCHVHSSLAAQFREWRPQLYTCLRESKWAVMLQLPRVPWQHSVHASQEPPHTSIALTVAGV